jgi:hypothetical protein
MERKDTDVNGRKRTPTELCGTIRNDTDVNGTAVYGRNAEKESF